MPEAETVVAKYVFVDIVGYTHNRSVEAQSDLVDALNSIVRGALVSQGVDAANLILLPTGDGMCVSLLNVDSPYDLHIQLAREILRSLQEYNGKTQDAMRRFEIRIDINANLDNLVTDINGRQNVAGAGISIAQRVMSAADGNQILVGQIVYETLRHRERYAAAFRQYVATVKHGTTLPVYQYVEADFPGLNVEVPSQFLVEPDSRGRQTQLTPQIAAYLAQAMSNRTDLLKYANNKTDHHALTTLLWLRATDSLNALGSTEANPHSPITWGAGKATFLEQVEHYRAQDYRVMQLLGSQLAEELSQQEDCFEKALWLPNHFVNARGIAKLKKDQQSIWKAFGFDK